MSNSRHTIEERNQKLLKKTCQAEQEANEILQKHYSNELIKNNESIIENKVKYYILPSSPHFDDVLNDARFTVWKCIKNYDKTKETSFLTYIERTLEHEATLI